MIPTEPNRCEYTPHSSTLPAQHHKPESVYVIQRFNTNKNIYTQFFMILEIKYSFE